MPLSSLVLGLWAAPVSAQVPGLSLTWQAPPGCPSPQQVEQAVQAGRLERRATPGRQVQAEVVVERRADGTYVASLTTRAPEGRGVRQLEGESCDAIAAASAVVLTLALDAQPTAPPPEPEPPKASPPRAPLPAAEPRWVAYAHVFAGGVVRALPQPAPLVGVGFGLGRGAWDGELLLSLAPTQTVEMAAPPGAAARLTWLSAQAIGCFAPVHSASTALEVCAGALYERLSGESSHISNPAPGGIGLLSPELGLRSRIRMAPRLQLGLDVMGVARPLRPHFVIGGVGQVHEMPLFDGVLQAGLLFSF